MSDVLKRRTLAGLLPQPQPAARRVQVDVARLLGPRGHRGDVHKHVGRHADQQEGRPACGPTMQTATPGRTPRWDSRSAATVRLRGGLCRGISEWDRGLHLDNHRYQEGRRRDPHRRPHPARLSRHVESDAPAGLQAPGGHGRQRRFCSPWEWRPSGRPGYGLSTEVWWTPRHPFKSSLTGETCQQFADDFEKRSGLQWTQPLLHYGVFEVVADALKRTRT